LWGRAGEKQGNFSEGAEVGSDSSEIHPLFGEVG